MELDAVIGEGRLPGFADQPDLPYINAVVTEVLRWNSVAPTGIAFFPPLGSKRLTESCRRSTYSVGRWFHWRLFHSERRSHFSQSMVWFNVQCSKVHSDLASIATKEYAPRPGDVPRPFQI